MGGHACPWHCLPARPPVHEPVPGVWWVHGYSLPFLHRRLRPHLRVLSAGDGKERDPSLLHLQHWWRRHLESCHRLNQEGHRRYYQRSITDFGVEALSVTQLSSNLRGTEIKRDWRMTRTAKQFLFSCRDRQTPHSHAFHWYQWQAQEDDLQVLEQEVCGEACLKAQQSAPLNDLCVMGFVC